MCLAATMDYRPFIIVLPRSEVATYLYNYALHFVDHWVVDTFRCYPFITFLSNFILEGKRLE